MHDPVIASCGYTFERRAIEHWLTEHSVSFVTGEELLRLDGKVLLIPNHTFKALSHNIPRPE